MPITHQNMELVQSIRQQLMRAGYFKSPCVWISPACGHDIPLLAQAVRKLQGEVAKDVGTINSALHSKSGFTCSHKAATRVVRMSTNL